METEVSTVQLIQKQIEKTSANATNDLLRILPRQEATVMLEQLPMTCSASTACPKRTEPNLALEHLFHKRNATNNSTAMIKTNAAEYIQTDIHMTPTSKNVVKRKLLIIQV